MEAQDLCRRHYGKLLRTGHLDAGLIDAEPIRARIREHLARGHTVHSLADLAGLDVTAFTRIHTGVTARVRVGTARRVMAVALPPTQVGVRRRLRALARLGHSRRTVAEAAEIPESTLRSGMRRGFHARLSMRIVTAYERLSGTPGACQLVARMAEREGWPPPLAWEDLDIDDPAAVPELGIQTRVTTPERIAEFERLLDCGETAPAARARAGVSLATLNRRARAERKTAEIKPCPGRCGERIPVGELACLDCWSRLPRDLVVLLGQSQQTVPAVYDTAVWCAERWLDAHPLAVIELAMTDTAATATGGTAA